MENSKDDLERHKAATVSLAPSPPPKQPAIITTVPSSTTSNASTMSSSMTEPNLSSLKRSHTVTSNVMTDIEQTITILLTCTKKFLEALTSWSMNQLNNDQVIIIYQHLADQFDCVKESLQAAQITMSDVEHIPEELYESLAATLDNYPPSKTALEQHLPAIRNIILRMLQSLKKKQAQLREITSSSTPLLSPRRTSAGSNSSTGTMSSSVSSPISSSHHITAATSNSSSNRSTLSSRNNKTGSSDLDMTDINTQNALAELKQEENLARRSSIRRSIKPTSSSTGTATPSSTLQVDTTNNNHNTTSNNNSPITPPRRHPTLVRNSKRGLSPQQQQLREVTTSEEKEKEINKGAFPLFLQVGDQVKKIMWQQHEPVTQAALGMAFFQKFDLTDKNNTIIKIQDPVSKIMYELEDMNDVGPHTLLLLIASHTSSLESSLLSQDNVNMISTKLDLIHQKLQENQKFHENHYETPMTKSIMTMQKKESTNCNAEKWDHTILKQQQDEIEYLRRDLGVLRQVAKEFQQDTMRLLHELKNAIATTTIFTETKNMNSYSPTTRNSKEEQQQQQQHKADDDAGDNNSNIANISSQRNYVMETKQRAEHVSTEITRRMQDLQDTIEQLKLDVTQRRCRPSQTQLEHCDKETRSLEQEIENLSKLLKSVKPTWKHTWEIELQTVVKEQQFLKEQESLLLDLHDDHADLLHVLKQLQKISEIQQQSHGKKRNNKSIPPLRSSTVSNNNYTNNDTMSISSSGGEEAGDMSNVLKQVSTIDVDHGKRVKALEQAEKMRARELANRIDDFEKELSSFVGSRKLKKTGGADHVDRQRERKDKQILKDLYQSKKEINHNNNNNNNTTKNLSSS
ncbi:actin interacting protein 3-domain-containing protein [Circinella umbellata]|nr:actin interacting protein 3-domain-containing protein [Circinella umbellata]